MAEVLNGPVILLVSHINQSPIEPIISSLGLDLDSPVEIHNGILQLVILIMAISPMVIEVSQKVLVLQIVLLIGIIVW